MSIRHFLDLIDISSDELRGIISAGVAVSFSTSDTRAASIVPSVVNITSCSPFLASGTATTAC